MHTIENRISTAIYTRLSREDESTQESTSIANQREFLTGYVKEQGWQLYKIYIDDGWSGTSFDRPGFRELVGDIEAGRVNIVVTKDLSRLGRDYIVTGYYLERFFPEHNIRYIAVNDGIDTLHGGTNNDMNPFRSVINDMYARDISKKVRYTLDNKRKKGEYIGAFAPYGYMKSPEDKNRLVPDLESAPVVERIFQLFLEGMGCKAIADMLNGEKLPSPLLFRGSTKSSGLWSHVTIKNILANPTYTGCVAQNKCTKVSYKSKMLRKLSPEEWITVDNTHEAIVKPEVFALAQKLADKKYGCGGADRTNQSRLLQGLVFCGDCGSRMTFEKGSGDTTYLVCSSYARNTKKSCSRHSVREDILMKHIEAELMSMAAIALDNKKLMVLNKNINMGKNNKMEEETEKLEKRLKQIKRSISLLYEDRSAGNISERDFRELMEQYGAERKQLEDSCDRLIRQREVEKPSMTGAGTDFLLPGGKSDKALLVKLIERIEIYEDENCKRVVISYNFRETRN